MTGQTSRLEIPYPTGTDPVADGDNTIQALAERVDNVIRRFDVDVSVSAGVGTLALNFGSPAFSALPTVVATPANTGSSINVYVAMIDSMTTTACRVVVRHYLNGNFSATVRVSVVVIGDAV
jgi:hypothetical protein